MVIHEGQRSYAGARIFRRAGTGAVDRSEEVRTNLALAGALCAVTFVILFAVMNYAPLPSSGNLRVANIFAVFNVAFSVLVVPLAYWKRLSVSRVVDLGLVYMVVQGLGICLAEIYATYDPFGTVRGVSWVCVWIVGFQLVVPTTPGKALLASTATATMGPLALLIAIVSGMPKISLITALYLVMPNYVAAGVAVLLANTLWKLREDVSKARQVGSYRMVERLGSGGMGEVWHAQHDMLARPAAIKLISPQALAERSEADVDMIFRRFKREAEATAQLTSEHTVRVFDFGLSEDGTLYYVMELLKGTDLETLVDDGGPVSPVRTVHLLRQACDSLAEAHERGLVHRDIKPANMFVCKLGTEYDRLKVLDFGLVSIQSELDSEVTRLTAQGVITGTPAFIAPEMVSGDVVPDPRVDVYSLGCVAYWMLTGKLVFPGETPLQLVFGHVEKEPTPPSSRTSQIIPAELERVVLDCLAKDPAQRPRDAQDLDARLAACRVGEWSQAEARDWWLAEQAKELAS